MIIFGTNNSETINAADGVSNAADTIFGGNGNDTIFGLGGIDFIFGESGDDTLIGGAGADTLNGGANVDTAKYSDSGAGVTVSLLSGTGTGGTAQGDTLFSIENLTGSSHDDFLIGNGGSNVLNGLENADILKGGGGADTLNGGTGTDTLKGGGGADTLNGGSGLDTAAYNESDDAVFVSLYHDVTGGGDAENDELNSIENLTGSSEGDDLWGNDAVNVLKGMDGNDTLKGYGGEDTLFGGNNNDTLQGLNHDDTLYGENGNDELDGGAGDDTMIGGFGNDTFIVDSLGDVVVEAGNQGNDTVKASLSYELVGQVSVQNLRTTNDNGTDAIDLTGNGHANILTGNAGVNILDGAGAADVMKGLAGNDVYFIDNAGDDIYEAAGQGGDTARTTVSVQLTAGQEVEALTTTNNNGVDNINLTGNGYAQTIIGNAGFNVLQGLGGDDQLQGMAGHDTLTGGAGNDKFLFNTALNAATNVDTITDFSVVDDLIRLDDAHFAGIGPVGVLSADAFHIGAAAADAEDRVIYNSATGQLYFDANGNAAGGMTLFANMTAGLALSNADFNIV